jgi:low affinity Fe/Cu permease
MRGAGPFANFSRRTSRLVGHPASFATAALLVVGWAVSGPLFGFSDTWQLAVNTATTIVTFLMVFLIQSTQNREGEAVQIKLDELIRATKGAHNILLDLEELGERDLDQIRALYERLAADARKSRAQSDTGTPEVRLEEEEAAE